MPFTSTTKRISHTRGAAAAAAAAGNRTSHHTPLSMCKVGLKLCSKPRLSTPTWSPHLQQRGPPTDAGVLQVGAVGAETTMSKNEEGKHVAAGASAVVGTRGPGDDRGAELPANGSVVPMARTCNSLATAVATGGRGGLPVIIQKTVHVSFRGGARD